MSCGRNTRRIQLFDVRIVDLRMCELKNRTTGGCVSTAAFYFIRIYKVPKIRLIPVQSSIFECFLVSFIVQYKMSDKAIQMVTYQ